MRSERIASLARVLQGKAANFQSTHSTQWMERSLDDSACVSTPELSIRVVEKQTSFLLIITN
jgi:adenylosuccinate lyase